jgi:hypothetical protein
VVTAAGVTRAIGVGVFVGIACVGLLLDQLSRRGTLRGPNFTQVVEWLEARTAGRVALFVAWGFSGWHFFVR